MKSKIVGFLFILLILVMIPMININGRSVKSAVEVFSDTQSPEVSPIARKTAQTIDSGFTDEAVKAVIIILQTNYKCDKSMFADTKAVKKGYDYSKIEKYVKELKGACILYKGKAAPVPYFMYSKGSTSAGKKYPYLRNAASPWDTLRGGSGSQGVSLNGINELCKLGLSCKEALSHYLRDVTIRD